MPVIGLAKFERESIAARDESIALGRKGFRDVVRFSHRTVIDLSPVADPDAPGSGRLRASWTVGRNEADFRFAPLRPNGAAIPPPTQQDTDAVVDTLELGDEAFIANGSPCVSTVNDRTSFVDQAVAATEGRAQEIAGELSSRQVSGARSVQRRRP